MTAAALTACSSDDITGDEVDNSAQPVDFGTYVNTTRSAQMDAAQLQAESFAVTAYTHATAFGTSVTSGTTPDFMKNQKVVYDAATKSWTYTPKKYWPANAQTNVSFVAWAPFNKVTDNATSGDPTCSYNIEGTQVNNINVLDTAKMYDLVAAHNFNLTGSVNHRETVQLSFSHALARVDIKVKANEVYYDSTDPEKRSFFVIEDVLLNGTKFYTNGTFDLATNTWSNKGRSDTYYATTQWSAIKMMDLTSEHPYSVAAANQKLSEGQTATPTVANLSGVEIGTDTDSHSLFPTTASKQAQYLFLIPGDTNDAAGDGDITVTFRYKFITIDTNLPNNNYTEAETTTSVTIKQPIHQGNAYNWNFTFSRQGVSVNTVLTDWTVGEPGSTTTGDSSNGGNNTTTETYPGSSTGEVDELINQDYYLYNSTTWYYANASKFTNNGNGLFYYEIPSNTPLTDFMIGGQSASAPYLWGGSDGDLTTATKNDHLLSNSGTHFTLTRKTAEGVYTHYVFLDTTQTYSGKLWFDPNNNSVWIEPSTTPAAGSTEEN